MNDQFQQNQNIEKPKKSYWKFVWGFLGIVLIVFVLFILGMWGWQKYRYWQDKKTAQKAEQQIKKWQQEDYQKAMADTYGGKTPQETLQMYIDAVEKGDYELASKYFIEDYQERELQNLQDTKRNNNIEILLNLLKQSLKSPGSFSSDKNGFAITKPILVDFKLYPNGIWKIIEI